MIHLLNIIVGHTALIISFRVDIQIAHVKEAQMLIIVPIVDQMRMMWERFYEEIQREVDNKRTNKLVMADLNHSVGNDNRDME